MSHDAGMVRAKLRQAADRIGKSNGHAAPETTSNIDPLLHELFVSSEMVAYWKSRNDEAKAEALSASVGLEDAVTSVIETNIGTSCVLATGEAYVMNADIRKPAMRLDQTALRNHLQTALGLSKEVVDGAFNACSKASSPAKIIKVASR